MFTGWGQDVLTPQECGGSGPQGRVPGAGVGTGPWGALWEGEGPWPLPGASCGVTPAVMRSLRAWPVVSSVGPSSARVQGGVSCSVQAGPPGSSLRSCPALFGLDFLATPSWRCSRDRLWWQRLNPGQLHAWHAPYLWAQLPGPFKASVLSEFNPLHTCGLDLWPAGLLGDGG